MINIHIYCSYKLSPVGYQYGVLQYPPDSGGDYIRLSKPEENAATRFVKTAFDHGFIAAVRGKLPDSYVFLVKRYRYSYPEEHADFGKDVYVNMAFEFYDAGQYAQFAKSFDAELQNDEAELERQQKAVEAVEGIEAIEDELKRKMDGDKDLKERLTEPGKFQESVRQIVEARQYDLTWKMALKGKMADLIRPDYSDDDYALTIDRKKLVEFMESMLKGQPEAQPDITNTQFLVPSDQPKYREELSKLFGLEQPSSLRKKNAGVMLVYGAEDGESQDDKKKLQLIRERPLPFLILLLVILMVLLGAFLLNSPEKELPNQAEVSVQEEAQLPILPEETENPEETESPEEAENFP